MVVFFVQLHFTTRVRYGFLSVQLNYTIRLFIFSPYPPNYAHYGGPTFVVYKKDGKPDYYAGSWYDPFPYDLKPVPPNWDDD